MEFLYLIILQITALILAIVNRKVKIEVLNDFKEMSIIVYTITILFIPLFAITYGVSSYTTISEAFFWSDYVGHYGVSILYIRTKSKLLGERSEPHTGVFNRDFA